VFKGLGLPVQKRDKLRLATSPVDNWVVVPKLSPKLFFAQVLLKFSAFISLLRFVPAHAVAGLARLAFGAQHLFCVQRAAP
jgi:hypothetical protein